MRASYALPTDGSAELRSFTHGLMPLSVPAMLQRFAEDWQTRGVDAWNEVPNHWRPGSGEPVGWWKLPAYLGDAFVAPLLRAVAGACIMQPNAHWTVQCLLTAEELFTAKRKVVLPAGAFPSVGHSLARWRALLGLDLHEIPPLRAGFADRRALLEAIDDRTQLVVLSHVGFLTGEKLTDDFIQTVARKAHKQGALLVVDGYHGIGSAFAGVGALDVDVYLGGLLKEGSGSSGNGFVYVRPELSLTPRVTGWFGDAEPFAFRPEPAVHPEVRQRFLGGTTAIAPLYHAVEGVRLLLDAGIDAVSQDTLARTQYAIDRADEIGLTLRSPREAERRSALLVFEVQGADRAAAYLKRRGILVDSRQGRYLRLAPFVWNTAEEVDRCFAILGEGLAGRRYLKERPENPAGPVT
ncbi:MAG: aminotransferase class V-fold PLP-dependent enzyme [Rhodothermales bacterium]|nr:aminotransferase class V-fold PLP-dependent enzyme [Rhodothermales bacterium]